MKGKVKLIDKMAFDVELDDHHFVIDTSEKFGGENFGPSPKSLLLAGLAGCTAMDVVSILRKQKIKDFEIEVEVITELTDEHPKVFKDIELLYRFKGTDLSKEKVKRAIELSMNKYCGVSAMLKKNSEITYRIILDK